MGDGALAAGGLMVFRGGGYISVSSVAAAGGSALAPTLGTSLMLGVPKIKITNQSQNEVYLTHGDPNVGGGLPPIAECQPLHA
ncbi:hypothetical protein DENIT_60431 [Pseudomonas veronii]|nr:hypothetical protein DENIT_60431 [Pseudomonas veronii]